MNGDVRLRVEGLMLERLLNRAMQEGARFHHIRRDGRRALLIQTDPAGADILMKLCERFSLPCSVVERRGRDALIRRLKRRATLLAGVVVCLTCMSLFFSHVWTIDIEPVDGRPLDAAPLEQRLTELGVRTGMAKSALDPAQLENALAASAPDYSFIGVRLQGVRLLIEAAPAVPEPELFALADARDLVASADGVVLSLNVLAGEACVQPGDTVVRGQPLIRGEERVTKEENRSIAALGEVVARTWVVGEASAPTTRTESIRTGRSSVSSELRLLSFAWPLLEGETYSSQEESVEILPIGGLFLPLEIRRTTAAETTRRTVEADEASLRKALAALAWAAANARRAEVCPNGEIADRWLEYTRDGEGVLRARAVYELHSDIATTRDALYQQGG